MDPPRRRQQLTSVGQLRQQIQQVQADDKDGRHAITGLAFINADKILVSGGRDGCMNFWKIDNTLCHFAKIKVENIGGMKYDELISLLYVKSTKQLLLGMSSGQILVYGILEGRIIAKTNACRQLQNQADADFYPNAGESSEIVSLQALADNCIVAVNDDQSVFKLSVDSQPEVVDVRNLFNDEIIDIKFIDEDFAVFCTNSDFLKLLDLRSGMIE